jgi:hypothetical protein
MEITYRTKDQPCSMGLQVNSTPDEAQKLEALATEMVALGFKHMKSVVPAEFRSKSGTSECYFYKDGSNVFGLKTDEEVLNFVEISAPVLKKYDKTFKKKSLYYYDND